MDTLLPPEDEPSATRLAEYAAAEAIGVAPADYRASRMHSAAVDAWDEWTQDPLEDPQDYVWSHSDSAAPIYHRDTWDEWSTLALWTLADELSEDYGYSELPLSDIRTADGRSGVEALAVLTWVAACERATGAYVQEMGEQLDAWSVALEESTDED